MGEGYLKLVIRVRSLSFELLAVVFESFIHGAERHLRSLLIGAHKKIETDNTNKQTEYNGVLEFFLKDTVENRGAVRVLGDTLVGLLQYFSQIMPNTFLSLDVALEDSSHAEIDNLTKNATSQEVERQEAEDALQSLVSKLESEGAHITVVAL